MRRRTANCLGLWLLLLLIGAEARADCVGETPPLAEALEETGVFFVGEVVSAERGPYPEYPEYGERDLTIRVSEWWGEPLPSVVTVRSSSPGGGYSLDGLVEGDVITVLPTVEEGKLVVRACAPYNSLLIQADTQSPRPWLLTQGDILRAIGPGANPVESSEFGSAGTGWLLWAASGAGATIAALTLWHSRRGAA